MAVPPFRPNKEERSIPPNTYILPSTTAPADSSKAMGAFAIFSQSSAFSSQGDLTRATAARVILCFIILAGAEKDVANQTAKAKALISVSTTNFLFPGAMLPVLAHPVIPAIFCSPRLIYHECDQRQTNPFWLTIQFKHQRNAVCAGNKVL